MGFDDFQVSLHTNVDRQAFLGALDTFTASVPDGSTVLVHFAGHGCMRGGESYLLPTDAPPVETVTGEGWGWRVFALVGCVICYEWRVCVCVCACACCNRRLSFFVVICCVTTRCREWWRACGHGSAPAA